MNFEEMSDLDLEELIYELQFCAEQAGGNEGEVIGIFDEIAGVRVELMDRGAIESDMSRLVNGNLSSV